MRVRVIYFCPRCGCQSLRPSRARTHTDSIVRLLGVHPQRCHMCRVRFYLFQPGILRTLADPIETEVPERKPIQPAALRPWDGFLRQQDR